MVDLLPEEPAPHTTHGSVRRDFLLSSITDGQAFVRATDTKSYVALVTQGLIVNGIVNLTRLLSDVWDHAATAPRVLLAAELGLIVVCFLASVVNLLVTVAPAPRARLGVPAAAHDQIFHLNERLSYDEFRERAAALNNEEAEDQLTSVAYTVAAIHQRKTRWVSRGYRFLILEVTAAAAFMATLGLSALS